MSGPRKFSSTPSGAGEACSHLLKGAILLNICLQYLSPYQGPCQPPDCLSSHSQYLLYISKLPSPLAPFPSGIHSLIALEIFPFMSLCFPERDTWQFGIFFSPFHPWSGYFGFFSKLLTLSQSQDEREDLHEQAGEKPKLLTESV